ncbi:putative 1-deoxy-D-xylulose 5-phosphate reductoisomerase [Anopheles sinensis]|uniref:Putative 1-deoxy-D-xylulose 5-phosphate reductoisomerase n=1 Tax=Anopheles sinensis TaxID=74873 RepID=A0A084WUC4_ANOSI|nr:putative 1-deoxy-D-xylulose 5-phosphate reductoisomerase [Anopheles sinensis]
MTLMTMKTRERPFGRSTDYGPAKPGPGKEGREVRDRRRPVWNGPVCESPGFAPVGEMWVKYFDAIVRDPKIVTEG